MQQTGLAGFECNFVLKKIGKILSNIHWEMNVYEALPTGQTLIRPSRNSIKVPLFTGRMSFDM